MKTSAAHLQVPQSAQRVTVRNGKNIVLRTQSIQSLTVVFIISNLLVLEFYSETD